MQWLFLKAKKMYMKWIKERTKQNRGKWKKSNKIQTFDARLVTPVLTSSNKAPSLTLIIITKKNQMKNTKKSKSNEFKW